MIGECYAKLLIERLNGDYHAAGEMNKVQLSVHFHTMQVSERAKPVSLEIQLTESHGAEEGPRLILFFTIVDFVNSCDLPGWLCYL